MKALLITFIGLLLSVSASAERLVGAAKTVITSEKPMWMAGYGGRTAPADGTETDLFAKALFLDDGSGNSGVVVTLDLVGIDRAFSLDLCERLEKEHGLDREQIALCSSHTHSGPVVGTNLGPLHFYSVDPTQQKLIEGYAEILKDKIVGIVGEAIGAKMPARVQTGNGRSTFAVNRRNNKPYDEVPDKRARGLLVGPVDHDVPVLTARNADDELVAILFGYACHATVLGLNQWNGDYPGYAQAALEETYPGATAFFWAGCGGDQNPLPRKELRLAKKYGDELAEAVIETIDAPMPELESSLAVSFVELEASLAGLPTKDEILINTKSLNRFEIARANYLLREIELNGGLEEYYPYPIGVWKLGSKIDFVFLGGEVVVDYALRLKRENTNPDTWVAGYSNDVMAYIPSLRVLKEGGYEGGDSNVYYGLPTLWDESIKEAIIEETGKLIGK
tara:strand:- start:32 stop:1381 length:1350 start_codon:yes stop_codon:yes gene_type:complete